MKRSLFVAFIVLTISAVLLSACAPATPTEDPNAQITAIAMTVQSQLTQVSLLTPSATPTPEATATPTPIPATDTPSGPTVTFTPSPYPTGVNNGDNDHFVVDVTIPDGTQFTPGSTFVKTWRFANTGTTTWDTNYKLVYIDGTVTGQNNTLQVNLPKTVAPGESIDISVTFVAPNTNGSYTSWWKMYSANGVLFGDPCSLVFNVGTIAATVASTVTTTAATATP